MRGKQIIKILRAIDLLASSSGATIQEMQDNLGIDRRSVYRMISLLEELGFPIYDEKSDFERHKRWKFENSYLKKLPNISIPDIQLTLSEILSLYLLKGNENLFKGTEIESNINSAFAKLSQFFPEDIFKKLNKIKALFLTPLDFSKNYSGKEEIINTIMGAIVASESCYVTYHTFYDDKIKQFSIDPLHLFEYEGGLYLYVNTTNFGDIRTVAVERIQEIKRTGNHFEYPADFDPEERIGSVFDIISGEPFNVRIWFSADQSRYIKERQWAKTQSIKDQDDGSIILAITVSSEYTLIKWILSQGSEAELIEPVELREKILEELKKMNTRYLS